MRMLFVSNHDKNSWEGTQFEMFGEALENAIVLSVVSRGMPLIYNGQEAGNPRRLAFFEKDSISWREHPIGDLYRRLLVLKKENTALWNGHWGAPMQQVTNSAPAQVFSFVRANETSKIFAVFNFSPDSRKVTFEGSLYHGKYHDFTSGKGWSLNEGLKLEMKPWSFRLFAKNGG
jgi:glycosidase